MKSKPVLDAAGKAAAMRDLRHEVNRIGVESSEREDGLVVARGV
jgi:hypothetical protein